MISKFLLLACALVLVQPALSEFFNSTSVKFTPPSVDAWRGRTIYQIMVDRFARTDGSTAPCSNLNYWCGGTWAGITAHLDYIQGMGFDALWISPVVENTDTGYHGYHALNLYEVNSHFGTEQDLLDLVNACHQRGIWVMVDVVGNHFGYPPNNDYSKFVPFNSTSYFHDCSHCPSSCNIEDWSNQDQVENCRLVGLPDINQSLSTVRMQLASWIQQLVQKYQFDGIRIDTIVEVPKDFWTYFVQSAGTYAVGEAFNGNINYVADYQNYMSGVLSYPLWFALRNVYAYRQSMRQIESYLSTQNKYKDIGLLGTFIDNHDNPRFLNQQSDKQNYKNALVYVLMSTGIPIIYYGTEQYFSGGSDPYCREPLWTTNFNTNTDMYSFLSKVITVRQKFQVWSVAQIQRYSDDSFYAFSRGKVFVATTNVGSSGSQQVRSITYHPYSNGDVICNIFYPTTDCITIQNNQFNVYLDSGEVKIYIPKSGMATN